MADVPKDIEDAERPLFEQFIKDEEWGDGNGGTATLERFLNNYAEHHVNAAWFGWLARALLSERERRTAQGVTWQPIETYHAADKFTKAQHIFLAHAEKRWIRMGRYYPEMKRWYYSGTNERSQWAQVEGDAPTHWQPLPAAPSLSTSAGGEERG